MWCLMDCTWCNLGCTCALQAKDERTAPSMGKGPEPGPRLQPHGGGMSSLTPPAQVSYRPCACAYTHGLQAACYDLQAVTKYGSFTN